MPFTFKTCLFIPLLALVGPGCDEDCGDPQVKGRYEACIETVDQQGCAEQGGE